MSLDIFEFKPKVQTDVVYIHPDETNLTERKKKYYAFIADVQRYYQQNPIVFIEEVLQYPLLDFQKVILQMAWTTSNVLLNCSRGVGKALKLDTPVLTDQGYKEVRFLKIGDHVFAPDGTLTTIIAKSPIWNNDCFEIEFDDGEKITVNEEHLWEVFDGDDYFVCSTRELSTKSGSLFISLTKPLQFEESPVKVNPYLMGLLAAGTRIDTNCLKVKRADFQEIKTRLESFGFTCLGRDLSDERYIGISLYDCNGIPCFLSESKLIPENYIYNSHEIRSSVIEGLIDGLDIDLVYGQPFCIPFDDLEWISRVHQLFDFEGIKQVFKEDNTDNLEVYICKEMGYQFVSRINTFFPLSLSIENTHKKIVSISPTTTVSTQCIQVDRQDGLFLCGTFPTVTHNSTIISLFLMAKGILFSSYWSYIASGTAGQAQQTFTTLERLANDDIPTFTGTAGHIFKSEVVKPNAIGDGFTHSTSGYKYELYNGSYTETLTSNIDKQRGKRGNVVFDECGFLSAEMINVFAAFAIVNKSFKTGTTSDGRVLSSLEMYAIPSEIPNQLFYISSASTTDSEFYRVYEYFSKRMLMGDTNYFVAEFPFEVAIRPYQNGERNPNNLLEKKQVEEKLKENPEKALREYYCIFTSDAGDDAILRRDVIERNSERRAPLLYNDTGNKKFIITYDPARFTDNSVITIGEVYQDEDKNTKCRIVNCINLADVHKKNRTPARVQTQISILRQVILDYNRGGTKSYSNILGIYIDRGAGGQAGAIADLLSEDWVDENGEKHFGFIDPSNDELASSYNSNAVTDKLHMVEPTKYKSIIYDALIDLAKGDCIKFTETYDNRDTLLVYEEGKNGESKERAIKLDLEQQSALVQIDLMKDQIVNMIRIRNDTGRDRFEIAPEKRRAYPHDDHSYTCALLAYGLQNVIEGDKQKNKTSSVEDSIDLMISSFVAPSHKI